MKIAIILSGLFLKEKEKVINYSLKFLQNSLKNHDIDLFIVTSTFSLKNLPIMLLKMAMML